MSKRFTYSFKKQAVEKALNRSNDTPVEVVAKELEIGYSTLQRWIKEFSVSDIDASISQEQRPSNWSAERRLEAVQASYNLSEEDLGAYCRQHGIYPHHITEWTKEFKSMANPSEQLKTEREEKKQLKLKIKDLNKELRRKDKALAEAAALLVLQKKVQTILGAEEDS